MLRMYGKNRLTIPHGLALGAAMLLFLTAGGEPTAADKEAISCERGSISAATLLSTFKPGCEQQAKGTTATARRPETPKRPRPPARLP